MDAPNNQSVAAEPLYPGLSTDSEFLHRVRCDELAIQPNLSGFIVLRFPMDRKLLNENHCA